MGDEKIEIGPVPEYATRQEPNANPHRRAETVNVTNRGSEHYAAIANAMTIGVIVKLKLKKMLDAGETMVNGKRESLPAENAAVTKVTRMVTGKVAQTGAGLLVTIVMDVINALAANAELPMDPMISRRETTDETKIGRAHV